MSATIDDAKSAHWLKAQEIDKLRATTAKLVAEIEKIGEETNRINAEIKKIGEETRRINAEMRARPGLRLFAALMGNVILSAIVAALSSAVVTLALRHP